MQSGVWLLGSSEHARTNVPLMALTATATPAIRDLLLSLLRNPVQEVSIINKPNISLQAVELTKLPKNGIIMLSHKIFIKLTAYLPHFSRHTLLLHNYS